MITVTGNKNIVLCKLERYSKRPMRKAQRLLGDTRQAWNFVASYLKAPNNSNKTAVTRKSNSIERY
jgi:hypothetical protein